jgi:ATP-dependent HslUV protease subunit HslV
VKIRFLYKGKILSGFAGSVADAITLFEKFEAKLESYSGNVKRAAVELAKDWRMDKILRRLEAMLIVASQEDLFLISGNGEVIEPDQKIIAIGSGGPFALSAATALMKHSNLSAREIVEEAMKIAANICIYTNDSITIEEI